jgi:hypothetical protein
MPDNRELASLILLAGMAVVVLLVPAARAEVPKLLRAVFAWRLTVLWLVYSAYCCAIVLVAHRAGVWDLSLLWPTFVVATSAGLPLVADAVSDREASPARHVNRRVFAATAVAGLYVNLVSFSLPVELLIQIVVSIAVIVHAAAGQDPATTGRVVRVVDWLLGVIGVVLVWRTTSQLVAGVSGDAWMDLAATVALSVWIPVALLPLLYAVAYVTAAETAASHVAVMGRSRLRSKRAWWVVLLVAFRGRLSLARGFTGHWALRLAQAEGRRERRLVLASYRGSRPGTHNGDEARSTV